MPRAPPVIATTRPVRTRGVRAMTPSRLARARTTAPGRAGARSVSDELRFRPCQADKRRRSSASASARSASAPPSRRRQAQAPAADHRRRRRRRRRSSSGSCWRSPVAAEGERRHDRSQSGRQGGRLRVKDFAEEGPPTSRRSSRRRLQDQPAHLRRPQLNPAQDGVYERRQRAQDRELGPHARARPDPLQYKPGTPAGDDRDSSRRSTTSPFSAAATATTRC